MTFPASGALLIGENDRGYRFGVANLGGRWVGFAAASDNRQIDCVFLFPEVSVGPVMGVPDRDTAILMTGAVAQDLENGYGGITLWHVPAALRGHPRDFRCDACGRMGCDGSASAHEE